MTKNRRVTFYIPEEWHKGLSALAGTFGASAEQVIRQSLPDDAVIGLFFQCRVYAPELHWDNVSQVGRAAIREHLRTTYMKGLREHLDRLGVTLESSAEEVEAARDRILKDLRADAKPLQEQITRAEEDSVYLGCLYEAWKRAKAGESGYTIEQVDVEGDPAGPRKAWAVLKENQII